MSQVLFAAAAAALFAGSVSWGIAAARIRRQAPGRRDDPHDRSDDLVARDTLVAGLLAIVGLASAAQAVDGGVHSNADWVLLGAVGIAGASMPFLRRFRGTTELQRDLRSEDEQHRLELLYEIASAGEELDVDVSSQRMADALVPALGDWAIVVLLGRQGELEAMGLAVGDDDHPLLAQLLTEYPLELDDDEGIGLALRNGTQVRYDDITEDLLRSTAQDERHFELLEQLDLHSAIVEPLIRHGKRLGAIAVIGCHDRQLGDDEDALLREIATHAASLLDNARLHRDLRAAEAQLRQREEILVESNDRFASLARTLQESLLPPDLPEIPGLELAARYHPAGDGSEVGGDFYDVFQVDEHEWCTVMGDVCGKGAGAARLTALARYTLRASAVRAAGLDDNLCELNDALVLEAGRDRARNEHRFVTATALRFRGMDHGIQVRAASAGHPPPLLLGADGRLTELRCRGSMLGMFDEVRFEVDELVLAPGDALVLYTDGVTEARSDGVEYGDERLRRLVTSLAGRSACEIAEAVEAAVLDFQLGAARDDIAVLVVRAAVHGA